MTTRFSLFASLACTALAAQSPPCISLNDGNNSVGTATTAYGFAGPGVLAYQFTPANSIVLLAAQIYTQSTAFTSPLGYQTLEIWDTNFIFLPQTRLGGGTWQNQVILGLQWQGASFDQVIPLNGGQTYWLVWRESGGNVLPYEPGGFVTPTARFSGGNWTLQATSQAVKWRGFCSLLDAQNVAPIGFGCLSSQSKLPSEFTNHAPTIGNANFQIEASGLPPGSIALVVLGTNATWISVPIPGAPGCDLHTDPLVLATVMVGTGNQQAQHSVGASGHAWLDLAIPADPTLVGTVIGSQFAAYDAGLAVPLQFVFSNGLRFTLY
ncbi:MAG: hypothetical protein ABIP94_04370 [Planctomycetota bacterium]